MELPGSRQSPAPRLGEARPEPGSLPSPSVMWSEGYQRYCGPLRRPARLPLPSGSEGRDPSPPWASRVALGSVPRCHAPSPGERLSGPWSVARAESSGLPSYSGRSALASSLSRPTRASPVLRPVGLPTPSRAGPMSRGLRRVGDSSRRLGSYWCVPTIPQAGLAPAPTQRLSRRAG